MGNPVGQICPIKIRISYVDGPYVYVLPQIECICEAGTTYFLVCKSDISHGNMVKF